MNILDCEITVMHTDASLFKKRIWIQSNLIKWSKHYQAFKSIKLIWQWHTCRTLRSISIVCVVICFSFVFACSSLMPLGWQIRHHKTSGAHPSTSATPSPRSPLQPLHRPLQQGPQTFWGLRNRARIPCFTVPVHSIHPIPILRLHPRLLPPRQSSTSTSSASRLLPILLRLLLFLPPCPRSAAAISV